MVRRSILGCLCRLSRAGILVSFFIFIFSSVIINVDISSAAQPCKWMLSWGSQGRGGHSWIHKTIHRAVWVGA